MNALVLLFLQVFDEVQLLDSDVLDFSDNFWLELIFSQQRIGNVVLQNDAESDLSRERLVTR